MIPKAHFTYTLTFVSVEQALERYNNRTIADAFTRDELFDNLMRQLESRGYISMRKRTRSEIQEEVKRNLPDQ